QPIWFWLVLLTGILLFFDVAVRRIAIEPLAVAVAAQRFWDRLRGRAAVKDTTPQFLDRLKSRKAQISEAIQKEKAARRFDLGEAPAVAAPQGAHEIPVATPRPTRRPEPQRGVGPEQEKEAADYASRLLKAKKRVWEEREKDKQ
ncbi:MAG TPA: hypothetical protein VKI65_19275, partial [Gemmataceae bacterium]|nr:hypothetical protein [Gemmataceae bacterium]